MMLLTLWTLRWGHSRQYEQNDSLWVTAVSIYDAVDGRNTKRDLRRALGPEHEYSDGLRPGYIHRSSKDARVPT
jgi:hypothetical protein